MIQWLTGMLCQLGVWQQSLRLAVFCCRSASAYNYKAVILVSPVPFDFFSIFYCVWCVLTLAFRTWAIVAARVTLALWLMNTAVLSFLSNKCSSFRTGSRIHHWTQEADCTEWWKKIASDKASCQSPRWYITACVSWAGDDIYHKKAPLSNTVESLK